MQTSAVLWPWLVSLPWNDIFLCVYVGPLLQSTRSMTKAEQFKSFWDLVSVANSFNSIFQQQLFQWKLRRWEHARRHLLGLVETGSSVASVGRCPPVLWGAPIWHSIDTLITNWMFSYSIVLNSAIVGKEEWKRRKKQKPRKRMNLSIMTVVSWYSLITTSSLSGLFAKYSIESEIGFSLHTVRKKKTVKSASLGLADIKIFAS